VLSFVYKGKLWTQLQLTLPRKLPGKVRKVLFFNNTASLMPDSLWN